MYTQSHCIDAMTVITVLIDIHSLIAVGTGERASVPVDSTSSNDPKPTTKGACSLPVASQRDGGEQVKLSMTQCGRIVVYNDSDSAGPLCWSVDHTNL